MNEWTISTSTWLNSILRASASTHMRLTRCYLWHDRKTEAGWLAVRRDRVTQLRGGDMLGWCRGRHAGECAAACVREASSRVMRYSRLPVGGVAFSQFQRTWGGGWGTRRRRDALGWNWVTGCCFASLINYSTTRCPWERLLAAATYLLQRYIEQGGDVLLVSFTADDNFYLCFCERELVQIDMKISICCFADC
jgi:hypothetical protein